MNICNSFPYLYVQKFRIQIFDNFLKSFFLLWGTKKKIVIFSLAELNKGFSINLIFGMFSIVVILNIATLFQTEIYSSIHRFGHFLSSFFAFKLKSFIP